HPPGPAPRPGGPPVARPTPAERRLAARPRPPHPARARHLGQGVPMSTAPSPPATARAAGADAAQGTSFTHRQIVLIIIGLMSGMFLAALDLTVVSTSIRTIADDLSGLSIQA